MTIETTEQNPVVSVWTKMYSEYDCDGVVGYMNLSTAASIHDFPLEGQVNSYLLYEILLLAGKNRRIDVLTNDRKTIYLELERVTDHDSQ